MNIISRKFLLGLLPWIGSFEPGLGAFFLVGMKFRPEKRSVFVGVGRWVNPSRESGLAVDPVGDFPVAGCFSAQYPA